MIPAVDVRSNIKEVIAEIKKLPNEVVDPSTVRALNRAMASARKFSAQELKNEYGTLPIRVIKGQMRVRQATRNNLRATLTFANKRISLVRFDVRGTKVGIQGKGIPKKLVDQNGIPVDAARLRNAFLNQSRRTKSLNVFVRQGGPRYPLQVVLAPALSESVVQGAIVDQMSARAVQRFQETLVQEIQYRLKKG